MAHRNFDFCIGLSSLALSELEEILSIGTILTGLFKYTQKKKNKKYSSNLESDYGIC